ncbi:MAG: hypothetical protein QGG60_12625 [Anaerolineales bacterium]|jgi:hypothetical protein|nr:hypothetical protein [Anaerolineales bacterium]HJO32895.1 hypothetical protein [Anaerolineales bacterium]
MDSNTEYCRPADWPAALELLRRENAVAVPAFLGPRLEVTPRPALDELHRVANVLH